MAKYVLQHILPPPVLVEDGLGVRFTLTKGNIFSKVLILVLVEDGLGEARKLSCAPNIIDVLILVLVEDGLGGIGGGGSCYCDGRS